MTKQADFKRRVRARMNKTGESYVSARNALLAKVSDEIAPLLNAAGMADALHVSNGDATDLARTGIARRILYWRDVLHEGPVPAVDAEELSQIRAAFLADALDEDRAAIGSTFAERDNVLAANRDGQYVLWFEADLVDQLQIIQILERLAELEVDAERITLICIGEHAGIARFGGLGELGAEQLRALPGTNACARLTTSALQLATLAWAAFRAPTPAALGGIAETRSGELRFLGEAFERLSREYPSTRDGLSLTERRLLAAIAEGASDAATAFVRANAREARRFLGDCWGYAAIQRLATAPVPLLDVDSVSVNSDTAVQITDAGRCVLAGGDDHVTLNGVDRWIGGVHLSGHNVAWRWDEGTESIVGSGIRTDG
ncbi:DUF1835 domain-containing protein [Mycolicibacterium brisbanense]|uniref:RNA polymerase, sigma-24 subunit, ECF subfamily n=1 Tax=Mycolicibacterium brisbanense TaxID=146020 RepID=A0A100VV28_9MYCO|nr:DUF1835 domain-containing protein [Mycolicibacterium brisbanense]GAS86458.1 RNA polymerase, sigma-24 subunit, ECF subfamily [Mycolicibacterium brisbanense]